MAVPISKISRKLNGTFDVKSNDVPTIKEHQQRAINETLDREWLLVEYGTGTGKTRVVVELCVTCVSVGDVPILLTVPNSLIEQTRDEFITWAGEDWTDKHVCILGSNLSIADRREALKRGYGSVFVLSHESFSYPLIREGITSRRWNVAIVDEASRFRNYSKRTQTLRALGLRSESRYAFTGNLVPQAPTDAWYVMNFLKPGVFGVKNLEAFRLTYCLLGGFTGTKAIAVRPDKVDQLNAIMDANRIKCELRDVRDLPPRELSVHRVTMTGDQFEAYESMRQELLVQIEREDDVTFESHASTYATRLQRLQEIAAGFTRNINGDVVALSSPKTTELREILSDSPGTPTVVWYWWIPELDRIQSSLEKTRIPFVTFGDKGAVERFISGEVNVFVSQLAKGGFGLNLTRAERMIYHSLPWSVDIYTQSQERNMRLTTQADFLEVKHLVVRGSVDEYVRSRLVEKADVSSQLSRSAALDLLRRPANA